MTTFPDVLTVSREENFHSTEELYKGLHIKAYEVRERKIEKLFFPVFTKNLSFSMHGFEFMEQEKSKRVDSTYFYSIITFPTSK